MSSPKHGKNPLALLLSLALATSALATPLPNVTPRDLVKGSSLIFQGIVVGVDHRNADVVEPGDVALPHTYVTFEVERTLKGQTGRTITLRFQGGPDGHDRFLMVSGIPQFQVGDRALLFVGNVAAPVCPLVGFEQGCIRLEGGQAKTTLDETLGDEPGVTARFASLVKELHTQAELDALPPVAGVSILDRVRVPAAVPLAPPRDPASAAPASDDLFEADLLQKNGGDPALPIR
ncbi:MAG: hypothetical protein U0166_28565 [Acidobacteriota bacterium]